MTLTVRLDERLEQELELSARKNGVTKSKFVIDLIERALGYKNPHDLMLQMRAKYALPQPSSDQLQTVRSENTSEAVRALLMRKYQKHPEAVATG